MNFLNLKTFVSTALLTSAIALTGCGGGGGGGGTPDPTEAEPGTAQYVEDNTELKGDFSEDVTLEASKTYKITGTVNFLDGTILTIPAGTTLYGSAGNSYLAINRGAKIMANGTAAQPIVFTSAKDIAGTAQKNDQGQWGGVTLLGKSTNNKGERTYEAGTQKYGPVNGVADPADNSGVMNYVIIKYSGFEVETDKELNGLSLGSVGSGTTLENIAVIGSADDGIEFWGGTVNVTNLYIYNAGDDSLDTDQGFTGTMDNVYVQQVVVDDETDSRAIEADSFNESESGTPVAIPVLKNATLDSIGRAIRLREGTGYTFDNVQVNVKSSSSDPASADYAKDVAAIRISDAHTLSGANITTAGTGIGIKNDAVSLAANATAGGDITANGAVALGLGLYRDADTKGYFDTLNNVHDVVGVSGDMVDEGFLDNDGSAFTAEISADNSIAGANLSAFDWAIKEINSQPTEVLTGDITADKTLSADTLYALNGEVNVKNGATLTIPAGTTLYGATGSSYLAINRGSKIIAEGTAANPIVFTSAQDIAGQNSGDEQGQWGGLTLLGQSTNNKGERTYEAGTQKYGPAGGITIAADNSGVLRYVVVKYSGYEVEKDKELNGISLASVGSGTVIENVASIGSADDGIELWGGTVSIDGLYVYNAGDDSIDTDQGYIGTISNVHAEQNVVDDVTGSRVIEADSHSTSETGTPRAHVTMENATLISVGRAVRLREGTNYTFNGVQINQTSGTNDADGAVLRVSDTDLPTGYTVGANGLSMQPANAGNLFRDAGSDMGGTEGTGATVTAYDFSWAQ